MKNLSTQIRWAIRLGVLSLFGGVAGQMALTDINHGGTDLTLEWTILRVCALIFLAFIGMALFALSRALKKLT